MSQRGGYGGGRGYGGPDGGRAGYGGRGGGGGGRGAPGPSSGRGGGRGRVSASPPEVLTSQMWMDAGGPSVLTGGLKAMAVSAPAPSSTKKVDGPPARPGFGNTGRSCVVRANHFLVQLKDQDFHHYDVSISPDVSSKPFCRKIMSEFVKTYKKTHLANKIPAYDGKKSLYTAGPLPFSSKEFVVKFLEDDRSPPREREFRVTVKLAAIVDTHHLKEYMLGRQKDSSQNAIHVLDVAMQSAAPMDHVVIGRSFFSVSFGKGDLGSGFEYWRGYYQSLRPTQMGLSLNVDVSARPFFEPIMATDFVVKFLNLRDLSRPLSDQDRLKVRKALRGIKVETTYRSKSVRHKIHNLSPERADQVFFTLESGIKMSVCQYFYEKYHIQLRYPHLPCIISGHKDRAVDIPLELCKLVDGERYAKKLNERQVTNMLRATCQRPPDRERSIKEIITNNRYNHNEVVAKEFGMAVNENLTSVDARILPVPMLKYHPSGRESMVTPSMGQWNMIDKKMYIGGKVNSWTCLNFSRLDTGMASEFCTRLVKMCISKGMEFNTRPVIPIRGFSPAQIERALAEVASHTIKVNIKLDLLIIVLPDQSGSYGKIKRICETELGLISQCSQPRNVSKLDMQYMENVSLKINVKVGGRNTVLHDAITRNIPLLTDIPTIIFGADVTHAQPGEDSTPSIAAVVASMDWPEVTKYKCLLSAQGPREEIIKDLHKVVIDPKRGQVHAGMIRELLIAFRKSTGVKPARIIFYRDGVSDGQFAQVLLHEIDAIRKACSSLEDGYLPPITFVVVQKRHHTRLFAADPNMTDRSKNIIPGTVVDTKICHPSQFDFYLCSHAGIQGTSRPTHYHVLFDENHFTADLLQLLTNSLCYTYARCTRSVSVVPPAYYAHLAAFRARYYMETDISDSGSASTATNAPVRELPRVKENVKEYVVYEG
ncbi:hypothetical protein V2J09_006406 [Rumex salicifolius]